MIAYIQINPISCHKLSSLCNCSVWLESTVSGDSDTIDERGWNCLPLKLAFSKTLFILSSFSPFPTSIKRKRVVSFLSKQNMSDRLTEPENLCPCCGMACVTNKVSDKPQTDVRKIQPVSDNICSQETENQQVSDDRLQSCVDTLKLTCISEPQESKNHNNVNTTDNPDEAKAESDIKLATIRVGTLRNRSQLGQLATLLNFQTGVEVGTQMGFFAKELLTEWTSCTEFHIVDLWKHQDNYSDGANVTDSQHDVCFQKAMLNLRPWLCRNILRIHGELSCEAVKKIPPIDFVYIDARHDYKGVMEDLTAYWPLVNVGGIMAGHDFLDADEHKKYNPGDDWSIQYDGIKRTDNKAVKSAVLEFFGKKNQIVNVTRDGPWCSWFVFKQQHHHHHE